MLKYAQQAHVIRVVSTRLPTIFGVFDLIGFERAKVGTTESETAFVITCGDLQTRAPLLRMHSQCFTGEVLGSLRCDCRGQLELAMASIAEEGSGLVIYEHQEGRGIGLMAKLKAYALQDKGLDTVEANHALGFDADCRDFSFAVAILHDLKVRRVRLLSNNPQKVQALTQRWNRGHRTDRLRSTAEPVRVAVLTNEEGKDGAFTNGHVMRLARRRVEGDVGYG